jgi:hypothetical protein
LRDVVTMYQTTFGAISLRLNAESHVVVYFVNRRLYGSPEQRANPRPVFPNIRFAQMVLRERSAFLRERSDFEKHRDRPVIHQAYPHVRSENPGLHGRPEPP